MAPKRWKKRWLYCEFPFGRLDSGLLRELSDMLRGPVSAADASAFAFYFRSLQLKPHTLKPKRSLQTGLAKYHSEIIKVSIEESKMYGRCRTI